jgi:hypothetical protein
LNIQCTQKLLEKLKVPATTVTESSDFFDWHGGSLLINRHNTVVFTNNLFRYSLVLYNLKAADFKKLDQLFKKALTEALLAEGIDQAMIDRYLDQAGPISYGKTTNRSITAQINYTGRILPFYSEYFSEDQIIQTDLNLKLGTYLQKVGKEYVYPHERLLAAFSQFKENKLPVLSSEELSKTKVPGERAFVLLVQLPCGDQDIWRKLAVPARITFAKLHRILQVCFNWQDAHLHLFQILADNSNVVAESKSDDQDDFYLDTQQFYDTFSERKRLTAYLPEFLMIHYTYDFGDDWLHMIELEETIDNYEGKLPRCLDGEGTAPPEDVGGEEGYMEFLSIVEEEADTKEKRKMLEWAKHQNWQEFDLQKINERLRFL